jgi:S1-C subfamily serine protease
MGVRRGVGGARAIARLVRDLLVPVALALGFAAVAPAETRSLRAARPLDHHATVLNGRITGSAFEIADGLAVTNAHVVHGLAPGATVGLVGSGRGSVRAVGRLVAVSPHMDLAVLSVPPGFLPSVAAADAPGVAGLPVVAAGMDATAASRPGPRLELAGLVLAPRADLPAFGPGLVARLPGVRPGFSGGPMFDARGALVGMVTAIRPGPRPSAALAGPGLAPARGSAVTAEEAFVLRAPELRAEVRRLLASSALR